MIFVSGGRWDREIKDVSWYCVPYEQTNAQVLVKCFIVYLHISQSTTSLSGCRRRAVSHEGENKVCCRSFWPCWHKFVVNRLWPNDLWVLHHGVVKENLTFRLLGCCGSCHLARHYGSVFCPEVKRHQQPDVQATVCWSLCRLSLPLLSALEAQWKQTFVKMLFFTWGQEIWAQFLWCLIFSIRVGSLKCAWKSAQCYSGET